MLLPTSACCLLVLLTSWSAVPCSSSAVPEKSEFWPEKRNTHVHVKLGFSDESRQKRATTGRQPIRIMTFLDPTSTNALAAAKRSLLTQLLTDARNYFQATYSVDPVTSPIFMRPRCTNGVFFPVRTNDTSISCDGTCQSMTTCGGEVPVPASHLGECYNCQTVSNQLQCTRSISYGTGVSNTDLVIYVGAYNSVQCSGDTVAYASSCVQETTLNRPILGYINVCPGKLDSTSPYSFLQGTIRHEIYHVLVFSPGLFAYYRDANGNPRTPRQVSAPHLPSLGFITTTNVGVTYPDRNTYQWDRSTVQTVVLNPWTSGSTSTTLQTNYVVTPKVRSFVRDHFNCPNLEGAMLENQGGSGTAVTHWEKRVFENEIMTGTFTQNYVFSGLTLSLMEDSGWYGVDYTMAEKLVWGYKAGCDFVRQSCGSWMTTRFSSNISPFCLGLSTDTRRFFCNIDHTARAICNLAAYTGPVPIPYRYMTRTLLPNTNPAQLQLYGGSTQIADFCPTYVPFKDTNTGHRTECNVAGNAPSGTTVALDAYGTESRCVVHGKVWSRVTGQSTVRQTTFGSGCYKVQCSGSSGVVIQVATQTINCTSRAGTEVNIDLTVSGSRYSGSIVCPTFLSICSVPSNSSIVLPPGPPQVPVTAMTGTNGGSGASMHSSLSVITMLAMVLLTLLVRVQL